MKNVVLAGIALIALILPATSVQAQSGEDFEAVFAGQPQLLTVDVGPNAIVFTLHDITVDGALAAEARSGIDNFQGAGDGDGEVTEDEVTTFEAIISAAINAALPSNFDFSMVTIDGKNAFSASDDDPVASLTGLDIKGAAGPVDSEDPITTDVGAMLRFDSVSQSKTTHDVRFENVYGDFTGYDISEAPPSEVKITGYKSWKILGDSIQPEAFADRLADDTISLTNADIAYFDEEGEGLAFTVKGDPSVKIGGEKKGSPGVTPVALLATLGIALLGMRRRL